MRIILVPVGKGKNKDILEVTIFGDFVRAACINFHINDIVERNLPKDFRDPNGLNYLNDYAIKAIIESHHKNSLTFPNFGDIVLFGRMKLHISEIIERKLPEECKNDLSSHYMPPHIIENILETHHQNSCEHPNEQLADWAYLEKTHPTQYIAGLATENRNVIETILEKNLDAGKLGLSENPVATEFDLIRILKSDNVSGSMRLNISKHQNLTKEVIKLFASEDWRLVVESLKLRKDIKELIDPEVRLHFQKCGSKLIRDAFIYNKNISDF